MIDTIGLDTFPTHLKSQLDKPGHALINYHGGMLPRLGLDQIAYSVLGNESSVIDLSRPFEQIKAECDLASVRSERSNTYLLTGIDWWINPISGEIMKYLIPSFVQPFFESLGSTKFIIVSNGELRFGFTNDAWRYGSQFTVVPAIVEPIDQITGGLPWIRKLVNEKIDFEADPGEAALYSAKSMLDEIETGPISKLVGENVLGFIANLFQFRAFNVQDIRLVLQKMGVSVSDMGEMEILEGLLARGTIGWNTLKRNYSPNGNIRLIFSNKYLLERMGLQGISADMFHHYESLLGISTNGAEINILEYFYHFYQSGFHEEMVVLNFSNFINRPGMYTNSDRTYYDIEGLNKLKVLIENEKDLPVHLVQVLLLEIDKLIGEAN